MLAKTYARCMVCLRLCVFFNCVSLTAGLMRDRMPLNTYMSEDAHGIS
jgi:hypothetical protein